jgi:hypothetical protein
MLGDQPISSHDLQLKIVSANVQNFKTINSDLKLHNYHDLNHP